MLIGVQSIKKGPTAHSSVFCWSGAVPAAHPTFNSLHHTLLISIPECDFLRVGALFRQNPRHHFFDVMVGTERRKLRTRLVAALFIFADTDMHSLRCFLASHPRRHAFHRHLHDEHWNAETSQLAGFLVDGGNKDRVVSRDNRVTKQLISFEEPIVSKVYAPKSAHF